MVSFDDGAVSVTCSPHFEKTVVPPPLLLVMVSLNGSVLLPDEIVRMLLVAADVLDAAVFHVNL
jgi:hypothetical protein